MKNQFVLVLLPILFLILAIALPNLWPRTSKVAETVKKVGMIIVGITLIFCLFRSIYCFCISIFWAIMHTECVLKEIGYLIAALVIFRIVAEVFKKECKRI